MTIDRVEIQSEDRIMATRTRNTLLVETLPRQPSVVLLELEAASITNESKVFSQTNSFLIRAVRLPLVLDALLRQRGLALSAGETPEMPLFAKCDEAHPADERSATDFACQPAGPTAYRPVGIVDDVRCSYFVALCAPEARLVHIPE